MTSLSKHELLSRISSHVSRHLSSLPATPKKPCAVEGCRKPVKQTMPVMGVSIGKYCSKHNAHNQYHAHPTKKIGRLGTYERAWLKRNIETRWETLESRHRLIHWLGNCEKELGERKNIATFFHNSTLDENKKQRSYPIWKRLIRYGRELRPYIGGLSKLKGREALAQNLVRIHLEMILVDEYGGEEKGYIPELPKMQLFYWMRTAFETPNIETSHVLGKPHERLQGLMDGYRKSYVWPVVLEWLKEPSEPRAYDRNKGLNGRESFEKYLRDAEERAKDKDLKLLKAAVEKLERDAEDSSREAKANHKTTPITTPMQPDTSTMTREELKEYYISIGALEQAQYL